MRTLAWALAPFCAAVLASVYFLSGKVQFVVATLCFPLAALSLVVKGKNRRKFLLVAISWGLGMLWCAGYQQIWHVPAQRFLGENRTFSACVVEYPRETDYGSSVVVKLQPEEGRAFQALLYLEEDSADLLPGDVITGSGSFTASDERRGEKIYTYTARDVLALGKSVKLTSVRHTNSKNLRWTLMRASHWLGEQMNLLYTEDAAGLLRALTTGDQSGLADRFRSDLSRVGLSHITAVSGMHLVFFVEFLMLFPGTKRRKSLLALPLMVLFVLFTGASPSVVRAAVMESILLMGNLLRREYDSWTAFLLALFVLLVQNPWAIGSIGLQLSFASVAGILLLTPRLGPKQPPALDTAPKRWLWGLWQSLTVTISATALTLPLSIYYFDTISLIAPIANLAALWCIPFLMAGGFLTGLLNGILPVAAQLLAVPVSLLGDGLIRAIHWMSIRPFAAMNGSSPWLRLWLLIGYLLLTIYCLRRPKGWKAASMAAAAVSALVLVVFAYRRTVNNSRMVIQVLDVGQGQCVLLSSGSQAVAVDCGGSHMVGAGDTLANALELRGIGKLDALILTHYDADHVNGVETLLERGKVTQVIGPEPVENTEEVTTLKAALERYQVEWKRVEQDETFSIGEMEVTIFAPLEKGKDNESGLSVCGTAGDFDVLMTGDMNQKLEKQLLKTKHLSEVEVLIAGHHGSRYSSSQELLEALEPEVVVISVGENSYGHPNQDTLDRLKEERITVYRTDLNGTVTIKEN